MKVLYIVVRTARISLGALLGSFGKGISHFSVYPLANGASKTFLSDLKPQHAKTCLIRENIILNSKM